MSVAVLDLLMERYPRIGFALQLSSEESVLAQEFIPVPTKEVFYLFGIGSGSYYPQLKSWLVQDSKRRLVLLEDSLGAFLSWLEGPYACALIEDPQVHIQWISCIEECEILPSPSVEVQASPAYGEQKRVFFRKLRLYILRRSVLDEARLTEVFASARLLPHILRNVKLWPKSFLANRLRGKFASVPAIICGAGPSLSDFIAKASYVEDRALILAGGSAITALSRARIDPHLGIALDPNPEEYRRLVDASAWNMPLVYATRVHPDIVQTTNGPLGYLRCLTGGPCEFYFEQALGLGEVEPIGCDLNEEALSVTTMALALAVAMGCNPILLAGVDLAYTGKQRYAEGVTLEGMQGQHLLRRKDKRGGFVSTQVKWVMEAECLGAYAKQHPGVSFFDVTPGGLPIPGIERVSLEDALSSGSSYDLRGWMHAEIQAAQILSIRPEQIEEHAGALAKSLAESEALCEQILEELTRLQASGGDPACSGRLALLEADFEEQIAFSSLLAPVGPAMDRLTRFCGTWEQWERKWRYVKEVIGQERLVF